MIKRLSFSVVIIALSMACGSSPTSPTPPVAAPPAPPTVAAAKIVSVTIRTTRDVIYFPENAVLFADSHWDDGSIMPITPEWESSSDVITLLPGGPMTFAISRGVAGIGVAGTAVITARAAGFSATQTITVNPGYRPRP